MWRLGLIAFFCAFGTAKAILLATEKVCYGDLGCFSNEGEFDAVQRPVNFLPSSPEFLAARYWFINRNNRRSVAIVYNDVEAIGNITFDPSKETKFLIHGYKTSEGKSWMDEAVSELMKHGDYNVFVVDWARGINMAYGKVCANARTIGAEIAALLTKLKELRGANLMTFHLIGSNIGAHIAGYAGERLQGLNRITGLDPTAPYFENTGRRVHLDRTDAAFVDVIHTDTGNSFDFAFGMRSQIGHVDFYPNGGQYQLGCPSSKVLGNIVGGIMGLLGPGKHPAREKFMCSHRRAESLFIESINSKCPFDSFPCSSAKELHSGECLHNARQIGRMGFHADKAIGRGVQMLETTDKSPFCSYHYQVEFSGASSINGRIILTLNGTKGSTGPIDLTGENKLFTPRHHFKIVLKTNADIGVLKSLAVKYVETSKNIHVAFDDDWKLETFKIFQGATQRTYNFCVKGSIVPSTTSKTFTPSYSCP